MVEDWHLGIGSTSCLKFFILPPPLPHLVCHYTHTRVLVSNNIYKTVCVLLYHCFSGCFRMMIYSKCCAVRVLQSIHSPNRMSGLLALMSVELNEWTFFCKRLDFWYSGNNSSVSRALLLHALCSVESNDFFNQPVSDHFLSPSQFLGILPWRTVAFGPDSTSLNSLLGFGLPSGSCHFNFGELQFNWLWCSLVNQVYWFVWFSVRVVSVWAHALIAWVSACFPLQEMRSGLDKRDTKECVWLSKRHHPLFSDVVLHNSDSIVSNVQPEGETYPVFLHKITIHASYEMRLHWQPFNQQYKKV